MISCPTCGAQNDPVNRFCDQCGTRLEPVEAATPPSITAQPPAAAMTCPTCGAAVVPGEAFCDTCGAALSAPTVAPAAPTASEAPTVAPAAPTASEAPTASDAPTVAVTSPSGAADAGQVCPSCGQVNPADAHYCDACGAELSPVTGPNDATMIASPANEPTAPLDAKTTGAQPDDATMVMSPAEETAATPEETTVSPSPTPDTTTPALPDDETLEHPAAPVTEPVAEPEQPVAETTPPVEPDSEPPPTGDPEPAPPLETGEPTPSTTVADTAAERRRLETLIAAHRDTINQYEQMLSRYPAGAAPAFLTAGLDEARNALSQSEADMATLPEVPTGPDPVEVQRLEALIAAHRDTINQYEQMLSRYPAGAAPAFLTAGLDEARNALSQSEAELASLTGGTPAATAIVPPMPPGPAADATPAPTPSAPPPAPAGARIVLVDGGHELVLPTGKTVIIVGREDPVSNIFPEIDMTPFGGESGGVSRQHARLDLAGGQWTLTDLNSTNYTRVDGNRLEPNTPTPIHDGSRIQFGRIAAIFHT
jgi:predicted amidophosphoribosyltransferase